MRHRTGFANETVSLIRQTDCTPVDSYEFNSTENYPTSLSHNLSQTQFAEAAAFHVLPIDESHVTFGLAPLPEDEEWWKRFSPSTILGSITGAVSLLFLIYEVLIAKRPGFPFDGAWVYMVYARNFFRDFAFSFNPGEHTTGPTSPFWTIFLSVGYQLFHDPIIAGKLLGSLFTFLTGYYAFRLLRALNIDYPSAIAVGILTITAMHLAWASLSGGDSSLACAAVMGGLWWHFAPRRGRRRYLVGGIFALATITRPETSVVFALLLIHQWVVDRGSTVLRKRTLMQFAAFLVILIPVATTNYTLSGSIFPQSFHSVVGSHSLTSLIVHGDVAAIFARFATSFRGVYNAIVGIYFIESPLLLPLILTALFFKLFSPRQPAPEKIDRLFTLGVLTLLSLPYIHALVLGNNGEFGEHARWLTFLSPVYFATGFAAIRYLIRRLHLRGLSTKLFLSIFVAGSVFFTTLVLLLQDYIYLPTNHFWDSRLAAENTPSGGWDSAAILYAIGLIILAIVSARYCSVSFAAEATKSRLVAPDEESLLKLEIQRSDEDDDGDNLPLLSLRLQRVLLLILIGWNIALLPKAAKEFAQEVGVTNNYFLSAAEWLQTRATGSEVVLTNGIGTAAWASGATVEDTKGRLPRMQDRKADYLLLFGSDSPEAGAKKVYEIRNAAGAEWPKATVYRLK